MRRKPKYDLQTKLPDNDQEVHGVFDIPVPMGNKAVFIGKSGTGKTYRMSQLVGSAKRQIKHLHTILISPTFESDATWQVAVRAYGSSRHAHLIDEHYDTYDEDVRRLLNSIVSNAEHRTTPVAIIYDDMSSDHTITRTFADNPVRHMFTKARQSNLMAFMACQKLAAVPTDVISNYNYAFIQQTHKRAELQGIAHEFLGDARSETSIRLMREAWVAPYDSFFIWDQPHKQRYFRVSGKSALTELQGEPRVNFAIATGAEDKWASFFWHNRPFIRWISTARTA